MNDKCICCDWEFVKVTNEKTCVVCRDDDDVRGRMKLSRYKGEKVPKEVKEAELKRRGDILSGKRTKDELPPVLFMPNKRKKIETFTDDNLVSFLRQSFVNFEGTGRLFDDAAHTAKFVIACDSKWRNEGMRLPDGSYLFSVGDSQEDNYVWDKSVRQKIRDYCSDVSEKVFGSSSAIRFFIWEKKEDDVAIPYVFSLSAACIVCCICIEDGSEPPVLVAGCDQLIFAMDEENSIPIHRLKISAEKLCIQDEHMKILSYEKESLSIGDGFVMRGDQAVLLKKNGSKTVSRFLVAMQTDDRKSVRPITGPLLKLLTSGMDDAVDSFSRLVSHAARSWDHRYLKTKCQEFGELFLYSNCNSGLFANAAVELISRRIEEEKEQQDGDNKDVQCLKLNIADY